MFMSSSESLKEFVAAHSNNDTTELRLRYAGRNPECLGFDIDFALVQIDARRKCRKKIPSFIANPDFLFPSLIAAEQASNESIARFHASLIPSASTLLDLTAGLGIDDMSFAAAGIKVTACELDKDKCDTLRHNAGIMGCSRLLEVFCCDSIRFLSENPRRFDTIFADPARRDSSGKRVHALADCLPDIEGNIDLILSRGNRLLVKGSPLLDISNIILSVHHLAHIYVLCFKGECKEVLIDISKGKALSGVSVIDLDRDRIISRFYSDASIRNVIYPVCYADKPVPSAYAYLYEPNAGVMKTGDWGALCHVYPDLRKADVNTHLFLSDTLYADFPGRILEIECEPDKKGLKALKGTKINAVARNHPLSAPQLCSKYGLTPGSDRYIYAFRYKGKPTVMTASGSGT